MNFPDRELTHPSWRRATDQESTPRESLMSQMVRAQLIFDRRTPPQGLPAWRDAEGDATPVRPDTRISSEVGEFMKGGANKADAGSLPSAAGEPSRFAEELAERLQLARDRVEAEHAHLAQVGTVADAYLGRPNLRLVK